MKLVAQICKQIFSRFGLPVTFVTDNGPQFTSYTFREFLKSNGVLQKFSAPYHPATNGQAEKYVQTLKKALKSLNTNPTTVNTELAKFLMHYRNAPHIGTGKSPASLMLGREIRTRLDLFIPRVDNPKQGENFQESWEPKRELKINTRVGARDYFDSSSKWKFGIVKEKLGKLHYNIQLDDGRIWRRHINQITKIGNNTPKQDLPMVESAQPPEVIITDTQNENREPVMQTAHVPDVQVSPVHQQIVENNLQLPNLAPTLRRSTRIRVAPDRLNL